LCLKSINEIHVISTFTLIIYYISLKKIHLKYDAINVYYDYVVFIGVLLSIYCIIQYNGIIERTNYYWQVTGNFPNPGPLGGFIAIILSLACCQLSQKVILKKSLRLILYLLAVFLMVFVLILSASRAAMLAAVVTIVTIISYFTFKKWKYFKYFLFSSIPVLLFIFYSKGTDSVYGRLLIWKISFLSFLKNPLTGVGYNFFNVEYINSQADYFSKGGTTKEILLAGANSQAFNEFLKFIIENGLLGVIIIVIVGIWIFKSKQSLLIDHKEDFTLASLAVYLSFIVFAFFSFPLQFFPFKLILLNQIALRNYNPLDLQIKLNENFKKTVFCLMAASLILLINFQYKGFHASKSASELEYTNPDSSKTLYEYAEKRLSNDGNFLLRYGNFLEDIDIDTSLYLYEKARKINNLPILYSKTANLYEKKQDYKSAENNLLKLHFIQPHLFKPQEKLLEFYIRNGNLKNARFYANEILKTPIKIKSKEVFLIKLKAKKYLIHSIY
jgi:O-antigen polymerase